MIKVSVIVPLHNSEKHINECMESIMRQTLKEIEIICVDSSTDQTREILKNYQKKDIRICILEDENSSYGYKVNIGIRTAKGKYICIVESDDYIEKEMLCNLYEIAEKAQVDFVKSNYRKFFDTVGGRKYKEIERSPSSDYGRVINLKKEEDKKFTAYFGIWTGLYNKEFLLKNGIRMHESAGASYQDTGFSVLACLLAEKVWFASGFYYNYRIDNAGSSVKSNKKCLVIADEFFWIKDQMKRRGIAGIEENHFFAKNKVMSYFWNYERLSEEYGSYFIDTVKDEIRTEYLEKADSFYYEKLYEQILILSGDRQKEEQYRQRKKCFKGCVQKIVKLLRSQKEIILFGAGYYGKCIVECSGWLNTNSIKAVCDNDEKKIGDHIFGIKVIHPKQAVRDYPNAVYIIANRAWAKEMAEQLKSEGIKEGQIYAVEEEPDSIILFDQIADISME